MATISDFFSAKQIESIRNSNNKMNIWEGAVSSGKTYSSLWRWYEECRSGPEGPFVILSKTYDTFKRNVLPELEKILGHHIRYYAGKRELTIKNRLIHVIGCSDERAEQKIRGSTFAGAYVDEITLIPESAFKILQSRLRIPNSKLFGTTNPDSPYHWFKKEYIENNPDVSSWQFLMSDNPFLTEDYKEYMKRQYKGLWYQRFIEGKWVQAEGAIYDFFDEKMHVIDPATLSAKSYIVGVDYGTTNPCAFILIGINYNSFPNMWVEAEYYFDSRANQRQKTDAEYADDLKRFLEYKRVEAIYVDPSAASFKLELIRNGFENVFDAANEVEDGIRLVSNMVATGTLKIMRNCSNLIKEFQSYVWDSKSASRGIDKPLKQNDHALDALRYALYTHCFGRESKGLKPEDWSKIKEETFGNQVDSGWQRF